MSETGIPDNTGSSNNTGSSDTTGSSENMGSPDDLRWRELLRAADPLAETSLAETPLAENDLWAAALQRLQASVTHEFEILSLNSITKPRSKQDRDDATPATRLVDGPTGVRNVQRTPWQPRLLVALAAAILGLVGAGWWFAGRSGDEAGRLAERPAGEQVDDSRPSTENRSPADPISDPIGSLAQSPTPEADREDVATAANLAKRKAKIQSVEQLLKLRPSQLAAVQRQLDVAALDQELRAWLQQWDAATPADRAALEGQWVTNRGFWVGWTLQGLREWTQPEALRAGIEVLSLEFGPRAAEALAFCWQRPATRTLARPVLLPRADESQLAQWLWAAEEAEDLQALVTELAQRPGPIATQTLAKLAAEPGCQPVLRQADRKWSPQHLQRALVDLGSPQSQTQFHAAMLLTVLPPAQVERELQQKIQLGQQVLPALAVLLLNFDEQIPSRAQPLFQSITVAAALPSARQRAQKWLRQQISETPDSHSLRKVCQQCVTAT